MADTIEDVKARMRAKLGEDADLSYLDTVAPEGESIDADAEPAGEPGTTATYYCNSLQDWGTVIQYKSTNANDSDRSKACGDNAYQSRQITDYGVDGSCGYATRYWVTKRW